MRNFLLLLVVTFIAGQAGALPIQRTVKSNDHAGYIKVYVQPQAAGETDILFLVDNSGSMDAHQRNLAANIPVLAQAIADRGISTNAAVLTADMDGMYSNGLDMGKFRAILKSGDPGFKNNLATALQVGTTGSGVERHFDALIAALSPPLLTGANAGFLRETAQLTVILLSEAEDQSANVTPDAMKQFLTDLKGQAGVSIYSFMSPSSDTACVKDGFENPVKIEALITAMGGEIFNLCAPDWRAPMVSIGDKMVKEITRTVRLPTEPVLKTIEVRYGSKKLTGGDLRRGWVYDESANAVVIGDLFDFSGQQADTELEIKFVPKYWQ